MATDLRSWRRPPSRSEGGEAGLPCLSIHVCRYGGGYVSLLIVALPLRVIVAVAEEELVGRKLSPPGGARTVMLICRDDFKICIHFYMRKTAIEDARENYPTTTEQRATQRATERYGRGGGWRGAVNGLGDQVRQLVISYNSQVEVNGKWQ